MFKTLIVVILNSIALNCFCGGALPLSIEEAESLVQLPLTCVSKEYPNKLNQVIADSTDLKSPGVLHPAFYGCFDWHSSVHGHWSLVKLMGSFPQLNEGNKVMNVLLENITEENIRAEIDYFEDPVNNGYERMYGWAWLLKLACELEELDHPQANELREAIKPLSKLISKQTIEFLPKLNYAIRVGTHTNTAFALTLSYEYALKFHDTLLQKSIEERAKYFYLNDENCPLSWEPSGFDFLSPCFEEANLMRYILSDADYRSWLSKFLPDLSNVNFELIPAEVSDRNDGHLVHLDGLNFSRAWCLKGIQESLPEYDHLTKIIEAHINHSLANLVGDSYEGGHWLASFALRALDE